MQSVKSLVVTEEDDLRWRKEKSLGDSSPAFGKALMNVKVDGKNTSPPSPVRYTATVSFVSILLLSTKCIQHGGKLM